MGCYVNNSQNCGHSWSIDCGESAHKWKPSPSKALLNDAFVLK